MSIYRKLPNDHLAERRMNRKAQRQEKRKANRKWYRALYYWVVDLFDVRKIDRF